MHAHTDIYTVTGCHAVQTFFPLGAILQTVQFEAPPPQVPHKGPLTTVKVTKETTRGSVRHLEVMLSISLTPSEQK